MANPRGVEPRSSDLESEMLPLHQEPNKYAPKEGKKGAIINRGLEPRYRSRQTCLIPF